MVQKKGNSEGEEMCHDKGVTRLTRRSRLKEGGAKKETTTTKDRECGGTQYFGERGLPISLERGLVGIG